MDKLLAEHGTQIMSFTPSMLLRQAAIDLARRERNRGRYASQLGELERYGFAPRHIRGCSCPAAVLRKALKAIDKGAFTAKNPQRRLLYSSRDLIASALERASDT